MCKIPFSNIPKNVWESTGESTLIGDTNLINFCKATGIQMMGILVSLGCGPQTKSVPLSNILFSSMSTNSSPS